MSNNIKKVGLSVSSFTGGGAERVITTLANNFVSHGVDVDLIVLFDKGPYKDSIDSRVNVIELTSPKDGKIIRKFRAFIRLSRYLRKNPSLKIMVTLRSMNVFFGFTKMLSLAKTNLVLREADTLDEIDTSKSLGKKVLLKFIKFFYSRASLVIANCHVTKSDLLKHMPNLADKITVIYNPLDINGISKAIEFSSKLDNFEIVCCGRLVDKKNFKDAISALEIVRKTYPNACLTILGDGPELKNLQSHAKLLGISESVHFPGFVSNPYVYYARSTVFVQTSYYEGFGYVLAEAIVCKVPVVACDGRGAMREILDNGRFGTLVKMNDIEALASAIVEAKNKILSDELYNEAIDRFMVDKISNSYFKSITGAS